MKRVGVVVLSWNGGVQTITCVESVRAQNYLDKFIVLVDNRSRDEERRALAARYRDATDVHLQWLDENRGYAGGNNAGIAAALADRADAVLVLTQDAVLRQGALAALVEPAAADARVGIVGPLVIDRTSEQPLSAGERVAVPLLCVPRTLLRHRRTHASWYPVTGVLGCALLLTRRCVEETGGFDEALFAYYEEVDLCLRARRRGLEIVCTPHAVVAHDGMRGFLAGFTPLSAELKARNLLHLMRRWATPADWLMLGPTYGLLLGASLMLYALRGRRDIVSALLRGTAAGLRRRSGGVQTTVRAG